MCLSTVYQNKPDEENIYCKYVAKIEINGDTLTFTDVMGDTVTAQGRLLSADLTGGCVIFQGA